MKKNQIRVIVSIMLCLSMLFCSLSTMSIEAADTKKAALKAYKKILEENPYSDEDGGFTAEEFNIMDLDGNGIPELIVNGDSPQIFTYKDGKVVWVYNSWIMCTLYYSKKTGNLMFYSAWNGRKDYYMNNAKELINMSENSFYKHYLSNEGKYYENKNGEDVKINKNTFTKALNKYMPEKSKVKTPYKNTKDNRTKYLK